MNQSRKGILKCRSESRPNLASRQGRYGNTLSSLSWRQARLSSEFALKGIFRGISLFCRLFVSGSLPKHHPELI